MVVEVCDQQKLITTWWSGRSQGHDIVPKGTPQVPLFADRQGPLNFHHVPIAHHIMNILIDDPIAGVRALHVQSFPRVTPMNIAVLEIKTLL